MPPPFTVDLHNVPIDGYSLACTVDGSGPPVVLIHGSLCDCRYWHAQTRILQRDFRVVAVSLRHYWPEQWDGTGDNFSIGRHARDIGQLIRALDLGPVHLVGHSRGGQVALAATLDAPGDVATLTLADPGIRLAAAPDARGEFRAEALRMIQAGQLDAGLARFIDAVSGADTWRRMAPWFQQMVRENAATLAGQAKESPQLFTPAMLAGVVQPTCLIGGALSPAPYPAILDALQEHLPDARRIAIPDSSHGMNLGKPRAFNQALTDFFADYPC